MHSGFVRAGIFLCGLLFAAVPVMSAPMEDLSTPLARKADPWVIRKLESGGSEEFLVVLHEKADVTAATRLRDKNEKGQFVFENLRAVAARTQGPLLAWLSARGIEHRAFWIANMVLVRGDALVARELAAREDIARLAANPVVRLPDLQPEPPPEHPGTTEEGRSGTSSGAWQKFARPNSGPPASPVRALSSPAPIPVSTGRIPHCAQSTGVGRRIG